ncbi:MAG: sulfotransferase [Caldilineaceae bacterium]
MASITESVRRIYHDLVLRRAIVRIQPAGKVTLTEPPIFLVGVYRSGTTLVRYVVDSHSRICCPPESNFLQGLAPLIANQEYRVGLARMGFDDTHTLQKLRELASYFYGNYANSTGKDRWADKTPAYVDYLDFIQQLFPESQFVMIYRHGLDQAHSFTRGGAFARPALASYCQEGEDLRVGAVRYWAEKVAQMMAFEKRFPDQCLRLRYEDLCAEPEAKLRALFTFLHEPWEPQVLEYYRFPHDKGQEDGRAGATRGIFAHESHYHDWSAQLVDSCRPLAEATLVRLGYQI